GYIHYILGIKPLKPQYELVQIKPLAFGTKLTSAKGTIATDRGDISMGWKQRVRRFEMEITLPANVAAELCLPRSGNPNEIWLLDGILIKGQPESDYLRLGQVGSGKHIVTRLSKG